MSVKMGFWVRGRVGRKCTITGSSKMAEEEVEERGNAAQKDELLE